MKFAVQARMVQNCALFGFSSCSTWLHLCLSIWIDGLRCYVKDELQTFLMQRIRDGVSLYALKRLPCS